MSFERPKKYIRECEAVPRKDSLIPGGQVLSNQLVVEPWAAADRRKAALTIYIEQQVVIEGAGGEKHVVTHGLRDTLHSVDIHWKDNAALVIQVESVYRGGAVNKFAYEQLGNAFFQSVLKDDKAKEILAPYFPNLLAQVNKANE